MEEIYKNLSLEDLPGEIWKDIKGYEDSYQISNMGRVKSKERQVKFGTGSKVIKLQLMKQTINKYGYNDIMFSRIGKKKNISIHRLVALAFIPNPENKSQINHKDGNKLNNGVSNLEWNSPAENVRHSIINGLENHLGENNNNSKLRDSDVINVKKDISNNFKEKDLMKKYKVSRSTIQNIKSGKNWRHIALN
jgi:hypothetical protein